MCKKKNLLIRKPKNFYKFMQYKFQNGRKFRQEMEEDLSMY